MEADSRQRSFARFAWGVLGYNVLVVLWGAYVRATGAGAGCGSHWPLCNGEVVPRAPALETIVEFTHRLTSGVALILVAAMLIWAYRLFARGHRVRRAAALSAAFIGVEALLGAGLVLFRLVGEDASAWRAVYLALHLANTLFLLAALAMTAWFAGRPALARITRPRALSAALVVMLAVSITGAIAALGDTLFPASSVTAGVKADFSPESHPLIRLRMAHPAVAVAGAFFLIYAAGAALRTKQPRAKSLALIMAVLVFVQLIAGVVNISLLAPVWMQIVHLFIADVLWIALVALCAETSFVATRAATG